MFTKLKSWPTRTRNKILAIAWGFIVLFDVVIIIGWLNRIPDAPGHVCRN